MNPNIDSQIVPCLNSLTLHFDPRSNRQWWTKVDWTLLVMFGFTVKGCRHLHSFIACNSSLSFIFLSPHLVNWLLSRSLVSSWSLMTGSSIKHHRLNNRLSLSLSRLSSSHHHLFPSWSSSFLLLFFSWSIFTFSSVCISFFSFQMWWAVTKGRACQAMAIISLSLSTLSLRLSCLVFCDVIIRSEWINDRYWESCYFGNWFVSIPLLFFNFLFLTSFLSETGRKINLKLRVVERDVDEEKREGEERRERKKRERGEWVHWNFRGIEREKSGRWEEAGEVGNFQFYSPSLPLQILSISASLYSFTRNPSLPQL